MKISPGPVIDRGACTLCGICTDECPASALSIVGTYYTIEALLEVLIRDKVFYLHSGGGVTLSGGEPMLFLDYCSDLVHMLRQEGIDVLVETSGYFDWGPRVESVLSAVRYVWIDIKFIDPMLHKRYTGRDNTKILSNIERLLSMDLPETLVRVPLIPDVVATPKNLHDVAQWLRRHEVSRIALLPYNPTWLAKAYGLGKVVHYTRDSWMRDEELEQAVAVFSEVAIVGPLAGRALSSRK